jgi:hypothetical protein
MVTHFPQNFGSKQRSHDASISGNSCSRSKTRLRILVRIPRPVADLNCRSSRIVIHGDFVRAAYRETHIQSGTPTSPRRIATLDVGFKSAVQQDAGLVLGYALASPEKAENSDLHARVIGKLAVNVGSWRIDIA